MATYNGYSSLREHMLEGNPVTILEAILLFGAQGRGTEITSLKKEGFLIGTRNVPMAKVIRRINQYMVCQVPDNLPYKDIQFTEYWIKR